MDSMVRGANIPVTAACVRGVLAWESGPRIPDIDLRASLLTDSGKVRSAEDFVYYQRPSDPSGQVRHVGKLYTGHSASTDGMIVELSALDTDVHRVVFSVTADDGPFRRVPNLRFCLYDGPEPLAQFNVTDAGTETALVLGELYRRAGGWRFRAVGQGYEDGLAGLAADHGLRADVSRAAALAAAANRRRARIGELETAARIRCEQDLRESPDPQHGRLRPGDLRWSVVPGGEGTLTTEQLIERSTAVPAAARFTLLDQIGTVIEGMHARVGFTADAADRSRRPEERVESVTYGRQTVVANPSTSEVGLHQPTPGSADRTGPRWLPRWIRPAAQAVGPAEPGAGAPPTTPTPPGDPAKVLGSVRAVLAYVVLPEPARQEVESLCHLLLRNLEVAGQLSMPAKSLHTLTRTADNYLPDCLTSYADALRLLPAGQLLSSGRTVDEELLHALRVLRELVESTMEDAERDAATSLLVMSSFLEEKRRS
jgi:stress response protein SCP2